jgi:hypothetical protein
MRRMFLIEATLACPLALAFSLTSASAVAATQRSRTFPPPPVGRWTRTVTSGDIRRSKVPEVESGEVFAGAVYTLTIRKNGSAFLLLGSGAERGTHWTGPVVPAGANRVHINLPFAFPKTYTWRVSGQRLTFTKISDTDKLGFRPAVFPGVWKRK